jgi:carboxypeptidase family protein
MESINQLILLGIISIPFFSVWNDYMTHATSVILGVVKDNDGNAISGARVSFITGPVPLPDIAALTDINGTFVLSAPLPGNYIIEVVSEQFIPKKVKIAVESNQEKHIEINLSSQES